MLSENVIHFIPQNEKVNECNWNFPIVIKSTER